MIEGWVSLLGVGGEQSNLNDLNDLSILNDDFE